MRIIKRFGVAGYPISHSKSPLIFNTLFNSMDIPGYYSRISARTGAEAIEMFRTLGLTGMNITTPLKRELKDLADWSDEPSRLIGAINTLLDDNGNLRGYNTDSYGVSGSLTDAGISVKGKKCLVFGAGNAGRAAVRALMNMGGEVTVINRTYKKAHVLAGDMKCRSAVFEKLHSELSGCDIFVSAVTSGAEIIKESWLNEKIIIIDANYLASPLITAAASSDCIFISGEAWLLNQAIPAFKIFTGTDAEEHLKTGLPGLIKKEIPPISEIIILSGDRQCIESVKKKLMDRNKDIGIKSAYNPEEFKRGQHSNHPNNRSLNILIYTGSGAIEKEWLEFTDLVVWGKDDLNSCTERIMREISNAG